MRPAVQNNAAGAHAARQAAAPGAAVSQTATPANAATPQAATPGRTTVIPTDAVASHAAAPSPAQAPNAASPVASTPAQAPTASAARAAVPNAQGAANAQAAGAAVPPAYNPAAASAGAVAAAAAAPAKTKEKKGHKGLIIGVFIVAVLLIAAAVLIVYFNFFASKPVYVVKQQVDAIASPARTDIYERTDNGVLKQQTTTRDGKTTTMDYKELVEGLSVSTSDSGKYEVNSDGYVSYIEVVDASGKTSFTRSYEYYSPGIIKSTTQKNADGSSITNVYDEDGWISQASSTDAKGKKTDVAFTYVKSDDGKTMTRTSNASNGSVMIYDLDENGNVVSKYVKDKPASRVTYTLEKIDDPAKMIAASSRLKG